MELFSTHLPTNSFDDKNKVSKTESSESRPDEGTRYPLEVNQEVMSFAELGMREWLCSSTETMGFHRPTAIQKLCIPAILRGRNVLGVAETGSGKTAAFVLPILQHLAEDPYGIFALVMTPTRELAVQISEQIVALGAPMGARVALVIGGANVVQQGLELSKRPHFVVATPGRMRHHLQSGSAPDLSRAKYLVLDEADRLISSGFSAELTVILEKMSPLRSTLLFSATLTDSLRDVSMQAAEDTLQFDLTKTNRTPATLTQEYLFMSAKIKTPYLFAILDKFGLTNSPAQQSLRGAGASKGIKRKSLQKGKSAHKSANEVAEGAESGASAGKRSSAIIFVSTCRRCQEIWTILSELGVDCLCLHSLMDQTTRLVSLSKFKNQLVSILVATDVASRGLDIPGVDLVVNYDLPRITEDYIHRVGRTARAGRTGKTIAFISESDISLLQSIESFVGKKMVQSNILSDSDIIPYLNMVSKASQSARMKLAEEGFEDKIQRDEKRRKIL